jgi:hypothetical protein
MCFFASVDGGPCNCVVLHLLMGDCVNVLFCFC